MARRWILAAVLAVAVQAAILLAMGQPAICTCGHIRLWQGAVESAENSQQVTDWYSFSHVIHGFLFYGLLHVAARRAPVGLRLLLAIGIEAAWELAENSPPVIERYRQQALAQGYVGDSVLNSVSDTAMMVAGFFLARLLPAPLTVALALAMEIGVAVAIRDNLTLNVVQLIHPVEAVARWQSGR